MITTFLATLNPILILFLCIAIGFIARKAHLLPENAGTVMAKLETWIFVPALNFITMSRFFTVKTITTHATNLILSCIGVAIAMGMALFLARFFAKKNTPELGIDKYALTLIKQLTEENERLKEKADRHLDNLKAVLDERAEAKTEVAREIFEEIEQEIKLALESNYKVKNYYCLNAEFLSYVRGGIDALRGIDDFLAELKKKYIGEVK